MKRTMFTLTALLATAMGFAQPFAQDGLAGLQKIDVTKAKVYPGKANFTVAKAANKPMRTAASGNYFTTPAGSMYMGMSADGGGYSVTILCTPGFVDATFVNMNPGAAGTWTWAGESAADYGLVDQSNNFVWTGIPGSKTATGISGLYPAPVLTNGNDVYFIPNAYAFDDVQDYIPTEIGSSADNSRLYSPITVMPLTFQETNMAANFFGYAGGQYGFGSGQVETQEGGVYNVKGVRQHFDKPMSPLYVDNIFIQAISNNDDTPLKDGATLTMKITADDGSEIATLTAGMDDFYDLYNGQALGSSQLGTGWTNAHMWTVTFQKMYDDPIFGLTPEAFVIDQPFNIEITGLDNSNVNLGFYMYKARAEAPIEAAALLVTDATTGEPDELYSGDNSLPVNFNALFDYVNVNTALQISETEVAEDCNVLRISEDGTSSQLENGADVSVYVETATPWLDTETGMPNYNYEVVNSSDGVGDWITEYTAITDYWEDSGLNLINFTATECPAGEGRWAVVNITGRGFTAESPIILLQGTATLDDVTTGIENAVVDNAADKGFNPNAPVYNLNGQRVSKSAKGILIQDGRKFIRK